MADEARPSEHDPAGSPSDPADLVRRVATGDPAVLAELFRRHGRPCYALARRICPDDGLAEQVVLEVFLALWRNPWCARGAPGGLTTWLLTLTRRRAVDAMRRGDAGAPRTAAEVTGAPAQEPAGRPPDQLAPEQRRVLALVYFGGCTLREVSALTGLPLDTVRAHMLAGVRRLRTALGEGDGWQAVLAEGRAMGRTLGGEGSDG